jgi:hypothetical protein
MVIQARPIENFCFFWHRKFMTEDGRSQRSRIQSQLKIFDLNFLQSLMGRVKAKLRAIAYIGVLATYKNDFYYTDIQLCLHLCSTRLSLRCHVTNRYKPCPDRDKNGFLMKCCDMSNGKFFKSLTYYDILILKNNITIK